MNQKELNNIAKNFIYNESMKVAKKLQATLTRDLNERKEPISGEALRIIHTLSLFEVLALITVSSPPGTEITKQKAQEYAQLAETLKPKYMEIVEQLRDFDFE